MQISRFCAKSGKILRGRTTARPHVLETLERPGTNHEIAGSMRGLKKTASISTLWLNWSSVQKLSEWSFDFPIVNIFPFCLFWAKKTIGFIFLDKIKLSQLSWRFFCLWFHKNILVIYGRRAWIRQKSMLVELIIS